MNPSPHLDELIKMALEEDMPEGDLTTDSLNCPLKLGRAQLIAKEDLILSGQQPFIKVLEAVAPELESHWFFHDGQKVLDRQTIATFKGNLIPLLKAERTALNFMGPLSGIATLTHCFCEKVKHTACQILDTRKTAPAYRVLQKQAVSHGGGTNHRMNLSDAIMIKENHLKIFADSLGQTIAQVRSYSTKPITIECKNKEEVAAAVQLKVNRIMLDNMSLDQMREALKIIPDSIETEATGNMTLERVKDVAELGVQFISIGALTHSAPCADISLLFEWKDQ